MHRLHIILAASQPWQLNEDVFRTLLCSCVTHIKGRKWRQFHNDLLHRQFLHEEKQRGSSCLGKLLLKQEQKRSSGESTPNHCLCSFNCAAFMVIRSICNQENLWQCKEKQCHKIFYRSLIKGHFAFPLQLQEEHVGWNMLAQFHGRRLVFMYELCDSGNLEDILCFFSLAEQHTVNQMYACYV